MYKHLPGFPKIFMFEAKAVRGLSGERQFFLVGVENFFWSLIFSMLNSECAMMTILIIHYELTLQQNLIDNVADEVRNCWWTQLKKKHKWFSDKMNLKEDKILMLNSFYHKNLTQNQWNKIKFLFEQIKKRTILKGENSWIKKN